MKIQITITNNEETDLAGKYEANSIDDAIDFLGTFERHHTTEIIEGQEAIVEVR